MVLSGGLCVGWSSPPALVQSLLHALPWQLQKCNAFPFVCLRTIIFICNTGVLYLHDCPPPSDTCRGSRQTPLCSLSRTPRPTHKLLEIFIENKWWVPPLHSHLCWWSSPCPPVHISQALHSLYRCSRPRPPRCCTGSTARTSWIWLSRKLVNRFYFKRARLSSSVPILVAAVPMAVAERENLKWWNFALDTVSTCLIAGSVHVTLVQIFVFKSCASSSYNCLVVAHQNCRGVGLHNNWITGMLGVICDPL